MMKHTFLFLLFVSSCLFAFAGTEKADIACDAIRISLSENGKELEIEMDGGADFSKIKTVFPANRLPEDILHIGENYWCIFKIPALNCADIFCLKQNGKDLIFEAIDFPFYEKRSGAHQIFATHLARMRNFENRLGLEIFTHPDRKLRRFYYDESAKIWLELHPDQEPTPYTQETALAENPNLQKWLKRIEDLKAGKREPISEFFRRRGIRDPQKLSEKKKELIREMLIRRNYPQEEIAQAFGESHNSEISKKE